MCIIILILAEVPAHLSFTRHMRWGLSHDLEVWTLHHVLYNGVRRVVFEWLLRVSDDRWLTVIECTGRQVSFWERVKWCCLLSRILPPVLTDERAFHQRQTKQTLRSEKVRYPVKNIDNSLGIIGLLKRVKHLQWKLVLQSYKAKKHIICDPRAQKQS